MLDDPDAGGETLPNLDVGARPDTTNCLRGPFTDLCHGFIRVMGLTKMTVMLGFTLASFNWTWPALFEPNTTGRDGSVSD